MGPRAGLGGFKKRNIAPTGTRTPDLPPYKLSRYTDYTPPTPTANYETKGELKACRKN